MQKIYLEAVVRSFSSNRCSKKFRKFHRKAAVLKILFIKVPDLSACNFNKKRVQHRCFPMKLTKFLGTPWVPQFLYPQCRSWLCKGYSLSPRRKRHVKKNYFSNRNKRDSKTKGHHLEHLTNPTFHDCYKIFNSCMLHS